MDFILGIFGLGSEEDKTTDTKKETKTTPGGGTEIPTKTTKNKTKNKSREMKTKSSLLFLNNYSYK